MDHLPFWIRLQWGHVFVDVEIQAITLDTATYSGLQWGHVFVDVEIKASGTRSDRAGRLQWGHVFVDVEISSSLNGCLFVNSDVICEMWQ